MTPNDVNPRERFVARSLRQAVLAVLVFGSIGTFSELYLLGHYEDWWQMVPLGLLLLVGGTSAAYLVHPTEPIRRGIIVVMWACIIAGLAGHWLHYKGNAAFEREMYPDRAGFELFRESMSGATPVLAAGTMTVVGLLGLIAAWRPTRLRKD